jgi:hypothetical protein
VEIPDEWVDRGWAISSLTIIDIKLESSVETRKVGSGACKL